MSEVERFLMARESRLYAQKLVDERADAELNEFTRQREILFQDVKEWFKGTPITVEPKEDTGLVLKNNDKTLTIATSGGHSGATFHLIVTLHNHVAPEFHILLAHALRGGSSCWKIAHFDDTPPRHEPFNQDSFFRGVSLFA